MNLLFSIKDLFAKISKKVYAMFFVALFFGLLTNGIALTSEIKNFDCILFASGAETLGQSLNQGRYIIYIVQGLLNASNLHAQVYFFNIFLSLIIISIVAVLVQKVLDIKNDVASFIFVSLFTSFFSVTCMLFYSFASIIYSISALVTICGLIILLSDKKPSIFKYLSGLVLFIISLGIYQSYTVLTICLINILFIRECLYSVGKSIKEIIFKYLKIVGILVLAYVINSLIVKAFLYANDVELNTDITRGADNFITYIFSNFSFKNIVSAYKDMIFLGKEPYGYAGFINNSPVLYNIYLISFVFSIILMINIIIRYLSRKVDGVENKNKNIKLLFSVLAFVFLPISYGALEILFPDMVDGLQLTHLVLYIYLPLLMIDDMYNNKLVDAKKGIFMLLITDLTIIYTVICIFVYSYYGNRNMKSLYDMNVSVHKDLDRLITRIQMADGYVYDMPIVFVGNKFGLTQGFDRESLVGYRGVNINNFATADDLEFMISNYTRFRYNQVNKGYRYVVADMDEVKAMKTYPDAGSIKIVGEVLVVKLLD